MSCQPNGLNLQNIRVEIKPNQPKKLTSLHASQSWFMSDSESHVFTWVMSWIESIPEKATRVVWVELIQVLWRPLGSRIVSIQTLAMWVESIQIKLSRTQIWVGTRLCLKARSLSSGHKWSLKISYKHAGSDGLLTQWSPTCHLIEVRSRSG